MNYFKKHKIVIGLLIIIPIFLISLTTHRNQILEKQQKINSELQHIHDSLQSDLNNHPYQTLSDVEKQQKQLNARIDSLTNELKKY
jgi:uncharacterized protein involved in exopolysaccharide biosynthesis